MLRTVIAVLPGITPTVGQYFDRWLMSIKDTVRPRTRERYESVIRVHIKPALGNVKLKDLTRAHVKNLYGTLGGPRHAHITLHKALSGRRGGQPHPAQRRGRFKVV